LGSVKKIRHDTYTTDGKEGDKDLVKSPAVVAGTKREKSGTQN